MPGADDTMAYAEVTTIPANPTDEQLSAALMPLYVADRDRFMRAVTAVRHANRHVRPLFPTGVEVTSVPPVPEENKETFRESHINSDKLGYNTEEADERCESNGRPVQYSRWRWALDNISTFVNMLREYGHPDDKIQRMFHGVPMCFATQEDYDAFRVALKELAGEVEKEMQWKNVGFVITGSSVPGFSQNPLKGFANLPSKITDPKKSDVDVCIVADGVNNTVSKLRMENPEGSEPRWAFPTTSSELSSGLRFGCKNLSEFSTTVDAFHKKWSEILPGGLQITFCEDDTEIPPWESRIDIRTI